MDEDIDRVEGDGAKRATDGAWARSGLVFVVAEQQGLDGVIATEVEEGCILGGSCW